MPAENTRTCICSEQQYAPIIFKSVAFQNAANTVYQAKNDTLIASQNGTLGIRANGNPIFKSNYERMQYLFGRQNQLPCASGVPAKTFPLGTN
jgi:hypothetical protein